MRKMHQRKLINTREEWEMVNHGLVNVLNILSKEYRKVCNFKNNRRRLIETFEGTHNQIVRKNFRKFIGKLNITVSKTVSKSIAKLNTPEVKMHNQISVVALTMDISLTYLLNKQNGKVIDVGINNNEHIVLEELLCKVAKIYITRTEIVLLTKVIRTTSTDEIMDHG